MILEHLNPILDSVGISQIYITPTDAVLVSMCTLMIGLLLMGTIPRLVINGRRHITRCPKCRSVQIRHVQKFSDPADVIFDTICLKCFTKFEDEPKKTDTPQEEFYF